MNSIKKLWHRIVGEPVWTVDFQGEVRKARLKRCGDGLIVTKIYGWCQAYSDGRIHHDSYLVKWFPR